MQKILAQYLPANTSPLNPATTNSMPAETLAVTSVQSGAFAILRASLVDVQGQDQFYDIAARVIQDQVEATGKLNTPVRGRIILGNIGGINQFTDAQGKAGSYQTVELDCAIVSVEFNNDVVITKIQGLGQSIKEFISNGDNNVTITGIYNSTVGVAPVDFIMNMNAIFKCPFPIPVTNYYLNKQDIYNIVIMPGTEMGQEQGGYAYQKFTIKAISDVPMTDMLP